MYRQIYVGIAFGLFGLSHLATILGLKESLEAALIVVRTLAYLLVAFGVYQVALGTKKGLSTGSTEAGG